MKIIVLIIVFNKKIQDSITFKNVAQVSRNLPYVDVIIVDNSTQKINEINGTENFEYIDMHGNKGLSKAYNKAIDLLEQKYTPNDIVVLLDDDTSVTEQYFTLLYQIASSSPDSEIFYPLVKGQDNVIYSPNSANFLKNHLLKSKNNVKNIKKINAISSCLAIRLRIFSSYRFDERLFLDEIDQKFCEDQRNLKRKFHYLPITVNQNFHQRDKNLKEKSFWMRYKLRIRDIIQYGKIKGSYYNLEAAIKVFFLTTQFAIKLKSGSFFKKAYKYQLKCMKENIEE